MFAAKSLQLVIMVLLLSMLDFNLEAYGVDIKCDPPCQPTSGYPSYGTPPPPSSGYAIYTAPPPPPPHEKEKGQSKCPPAAGVQCCTPPVSYPYGPPSPPNTYGPPNPYNTYAPPNPYTYVPYGEGGRSANSSVLLPFRVLMSMLFSSFLLF